jgi:DUF971 family protein
VWDARYKFKYEGTISTLIAALGVDPSLLATFMSYREKVVSTVAAAGKWGVRIKFNDFEQSVFHTTSSVQTVQKPKRQFWELEDYITEFKHPTSNGHLET